MLVGRQRLIGRFAAPGGARRHHRPVDLLRGVVPRRHHRGDPAILADHEGHPLDQAVGDRGTVHILDAGERLDGGEVVGAGDLQCLVAGDGEFSGAESGIEAKRLSRSRLSPDTPMMLAPAASNFSLFSAKVWASRSQPCV